MKTETWPLERLIDYARNPRKNDHAVDRVAAAIREFGFRVPIVAKSDGLVVDGHLRLKAARKLGLAEVPVVLADDLTDAQVKAFRISVNRMAELAEWDSELLALELGELGELGFDLELTGFDGDEIDALTPEVLPEGKTDPDEAPEPPAKPRSVLGDVWLLGKHRVMCGDSTSIDAVEALMAGGKAQTFLTDPPYGDNVGGLSPKASHEREPGKGLVKRVAFIANDKEIDWLEEVFNLVPGFLEEDGTKMVFFKWDRLEQIKSMAAAFGEPSALCVWDRVRKASAFFRFQPQHELCFHWGNQADKKEPMDLSNVWRVPKELELKELHPTVKPVAIIEPALRVTTATGKRVLDLFGGSGTTLIAAEASGRIAHLMELDPRYVDVIVKRWQDFTGKQATRESDGKLFDEVT